MPRRQSRTHYRSLNAKEKRLAALQLRREGRNYQQIGEAMGTTRGTAHRWVAIELEAIEIQCAETATDVKRLELARIDEALEAIYSKVKAGDLFAIDRMLKLMERRAKLLGLDAPEKVAPTNPAGDQPYESLGDDERFARALALLESARARRAAAALDASAADAGAPGSELADVAADPVSPVPLGP